jgi:hypothetical protein
MQTVSEERFERELKHRLGESWDQALRLFRLFGPSISNDLLDVLWIACAQRKADEVLSVLQGLCDSHVPSRIGDSPPLIDERHIEVALALVIQDTLGLKESTGTFTFPQCRRKA